MALSACVECGKAISTSAKVCPNCGKKDPHTSGKLKLIAFLIFGVPMFAMCSGMCSKSSSSTSSASAAPPQLSPEAQAKAEAEKQAKAAAEEARCREDLQCLGDKGMVGAGIRCKRPIESLAKYAHEWTDGMLEPKMSHYRWKDKKRGIVTFLGDKLRFQNGFGAWQNVVYECDYDGESVLSVRARPGKL